MRDWLLSQAPPGIQILLSIQQWQSPLLNVFMKAITDLGSVQFALILAPTVLWCVNKQMGIGLTFAYLGTNYINTALKVFWHIPRPFATDFQEWNKELRPLRSEASFSWPSAHAQTSVGVGGYLAYKVKKWWFVVICVVLMILIGFSRMYVGVHTHTDVIGGWLFGALCLAAAAWLEPLLSSRLGSLPLAAQIGLAAGVPIVLALITPVQDAISITGALLGLTVGFVLEARYVAFSVQGVWQKRVLRGLVGLLILLSTYLGLRVLAPEVESLWLSLILRFVRYAIVGFFAAFVVPWILVKARLADRIDLRQKQNA